MLTPRGADTVGKQPIRTVHRAGFNFRPLGNLRFNLTHSRDGSESRSQPPARPPCQHPIPPTIPNPIPDHPSPSPTTSQPTCSVPALDLSQHSNYSSNTWLLCPKCLEKGPALPMIRQKLFQSFSRKQQLLFLDLQIPLPSSAPNLLWPTVSLVLARPEISAIRST